MAAAKKKKEAKKAEKEAMKEAEQTPAAKQEPTSNKEGEVQAQDNPGSILLCLYCFSFPILDYCCQKIIPSRTAFIKLFVISETVIPYCRCV